MVVDKVDFRIASVMVDIIVTVADNRVENNQNPKISILVRKLIDIIDQNVVVM